MEARVGVSSSLVQITQGLVVTLLAGSVLLLARVRHRRRRVADAEPSSVAEPA
jgi:hypothetical protein